MKIIVRYNGGTQAIQNCSNPTQLEIGKMYHVEEVEEKDFYTNYTLREVKGKFNSCWFDIVQEKTYMGIAYKEPVKGEKMQCFIIRLDEKSLKLKECKTSTVEDVKKLGNKIFMVTTKNSEYIIQVR